LWVDILEKADTIDDIMKTTKIRKHRIEATLGKDFVVEAANLLSDRTEVYKVGTRFDGRDILKHGGYRVVTGHGSSFLIPFEYFNKFVEKWEQADTEVVRGRTLTKIGECEADEYRNPQDYLVRNQDIVNECDVLVATPKENNEVLRSGTWATIRRATKAKKPVLIVNPDGMTIIR